MKRIPSILLLAALFASLAVPAGAQNYPTRPVRMVVPFSPGGGSDITGRILATGLSETLGQTIVVDNRPGAGSTLGWNIVSQSTPDGYTTLLGNISAAFNTALYKKLPYDAIRDFTPVSLVTQQPNMLVANPAFAAKSFKEFLSLAESQPGKFTFGSAGLGTGTHLAMEMLLMSRKLDLVHVPYKGTGPAIIAVLGNQISVFLSTYASALSHVKAGRLRALAVTSVKRTSTLPQVPTVAESGFLGFEYYTWYGVLVPAKTPRAIVQRLNQATVSALNLDKTRKSYLAQGVDAIPSTPEQFVAHLDSEIKRWGKVVRAAKIPQQ
ncbi:MAG: tripartite tricarboxylate transporter substrate binding protein [Betaproteobacteria bacterium]|nr:tripartite tricarboxylate transporter substrate binding protein [Betaproteobacteria bacterium]